MTEIARREPVVKTPEDFQMQAIWVDFPALMVDVAEIGRHLAYASLDIDRNDSSSIGPKVLKALEDFRKIMTNVTGKEREIPTKLDEIIPLPVALVYTPENTEAGRKQLCYAVKEIMMKLLMIYDDPNKDNLTALVSCEQFVMECFAKIAALLLALQSVEKKKQQQELEESRKQFELRKSKLQICL